MIKTFLKFITTRLLVGKLFEKIKPNLPIISILVFIIFIIFYGPFEYQNYLEFKQKFPNNTIGLYLILIRPLIIVSLFITTITYITLNKKKIEREEKEKAERLAQEKAEFQAKKEAAMRKLQELKNNPIGKTASAMTTKESIGVIGGAGVGAALGGSLGVAGKFLGGMVFVNGGWVLAGIGGLVGYLGVKAFKKNKATKEERARIIKEEHEKIKAYGNQINQDTRDKH
ncbi:hypothetical protein PQZ38_00790 [Pelagibacteraceae bacterium]|nr:hypothetical protein [Pelagibacteraceae bacterium]